MDYQTKMKVKAFLNKPIITYALLGVTILVFFGMELAGGSENKQVLLDWGAMSKERVVVYHEYWRFFTPMFLHIGWMHIILNMITLYYVGAQVESVYGHWRYLLIYLVSGLLGNFVSFGFGSQYNISAGASTSIFGLFGALIILGWHFKDNPAIRFMVQRYSVFIGMTLVFNLFSTSVDILGHVGGLLGGLLAGTIAGVPKSSEKFTIHQRIISTMIIIFIFVVCFFLGFKNYNYLV